VSKASNAGAINAVEGLFADTPDGPRLLGSKCTSCSACYFPRSQICHNPDCDSSRIEDARFGPSGTLWSVALQNYPPPAPAVIPEPYSPYAVGVVDMADGIRVLGRMLCDDPKALEIGSKVELVLAPLGQNESGEDVISWHFQPA
jgi:uncharacterized OB-fold protein